MKINISETSNPHHGAYTRLHPVSALISSLAFHFHINLFFYFLVAISANFIIVLLLYCKVVASGRELEHEDPEAVIIGGMVLDIHATPSVHANPGTTTPGKVS